MKICRQLFVLLFVVCCLFSSLIAQGVVDANTTLLLRFEGNFNGEQGEVPLQNSSGFTNGLFGQGVNFTNQNSIIFESNNNISSTEGTIEFWVKPSWAGSDGIHHTFLSWDGNGGMLVQKDSANNLRIILDQFQVEKGVSTPVGFWRAYKWHYLAFSYSDTHKRLRLYIDGNEIATTTFTGSLPLINSPTFKIGNDPYYRSANAIIDDFRISNVERTPKDISQSYLSNVRSLGLTDQLIDYSFDVGSGDSNAVTTIDEFSDGRVVLGGAFYDFNGEYLNKIIRLNPDGSKDLTFNSLANNFGQNPNYGINDLKIQPDGKVVVAVNIPQTDGTVLSQVVRLNYDGTTDSTFLPVTLNNVPWTLALQPDGKIIVGGNFTYFEGVNTNRLLRLNSDGTLDTSFNIGTGFNGLVFQTKLLSNGKILVGGIFTAFNGLPKYRLVQLNPDGSLDNTFNPTGIGFNSTVYAIEPLTDGKVIVAGNFTTFNGIACKYIVRLNADGSLDTNSSFTNLKNITAITKIGVLSSGKILIRSNLYDPIGVISEAILRLNSDGSLDGSFNGGSGLVIPIVNSIKPLQSGKAYIGGAFNEFNNILGINGVFRLNSEISANTPPETLITTGPSEQEVIQTSNVTFNWTGSDDTTPQGRLQYQYQLDNNGWSTISPSNYVNLTSLSEGQHSFQVRAIDNFGNIDSTPVTRSFIIDTALKFANLEITNITPNSATVNWTTDKNSTGIVQFAVDTGNFIFSVNDGNNTTNHSVNLANLSSQTIYRVKVTANNSVGGQSISNIVSFTTLPLADVLVKDSEINLSNPIPANGETITASALVRNGGDMPTTTTVVFYDQIANGSQQEVGRQTVTIEPNSAGLVVNSNPFAVSEGTHSLFVQLINSNPTETNPNNNQAVKNYNVNAPANRFAIEVSNQQTFAGNDSTFVATIRNNGSQPQVLTSADITGIPWISRVSPLPNIPINPNEEIQLLFRMQTPSNQAGGDAANPILLPAQFTISGGIADPKNFAIEVYNSPPSVLDITITDKGTGQPIQGATVAVDSLPQTFTTGANGKPVDQNGNPILVNVAGGNTVVSAFASNFSPGSIALGNSGVVPVQLQLDSSGGLVVQEVNARELSAEEVIARGVNVEDPANNWVWDFAIVYGPGEVFQVPNVVLPKGGNGSPGGGAVGGGYIPSCNCSVKWNIQVSPTGERKEDWLVIKGDIRILKQFWEVTQVVKNTSSSRTFTNVSTNLLLPIGLSFPELNGSPQSPVKQLGNLGPNQTAQSTWVIRGDLPGKYRVNGTTQADGFATVSLQSNEIEVAEPLLTTIIDAPEAVTAQVPFDVRLNLRNDSVIPFNLVRVRIKQCLNCEVINNPLVDLGTIQIKETKTATFTILPLVSGVLKYKGITKSPIPIGSDLEVKGNPYKISGQAVCKNIPVSGVQVTAKLNNADFAKTITDNNGYYELTLFGGSNYSVGISSSGFSFVPPYQTFTNLSANQTLNFGCNSANLLISEFRFHGNNPADDFVEIYNASDTTADISGYAIVTSDNPTVPKYVVPGEIGSKTTTIPARGHFLVTGAGYTLGGYAAGDGNLNADVPDNAGVGLFLNGTNISANSRIDAVGFNPNTSPFSEGTSLNPIGGVLTNGETSFVRNFGAQGYPVDTDNNLADFSFVSTDAGIYNGLQSILGAPGPENRLSPIFKPNNVTAAVFDSGAGISAVPNKVTNAANTQAAPLGTIASRRTYTNNTGFPITKFRLRIIGISTLGSPKIYNPQAVVKALSSADISIIKSDGSTVLVKGLTIESPSPVTGGGLNSSLIVTLNQPINPGESISVDTIIGVFANGRLIFNTAVETNIAQGN